MLVADRYIEDYDKWNKKANSELKKIDDELQTEAYKNARESKIYYISNYNEILENARKSEKGRELIKDYEQLSEETHEKSQLMRGRRFSLRQNARKILPVITERKYIPINLNSLDPFNTPHISYLEFVNILKKFAYKEPINNGNLFGIFYQGQLEYFVYIYYTPNMPWEFDTEIASATFISSGIIISNKSS